MEAWLFQIRKKNPRSLKINFEIIPQVWYLFCRNSSVETCLYSGSHFPKRWHRLVTRDCAFIYTLWCLLTSILTFYISRTVFGKLHSIIHLLKKTNKQADKHQILPKQQNKSQTVWHDIWDTFLTSVVVPTIYKKRWWSTLFDSFLVLEINYQAL